MSAWSDWKCGAITDEQYESMMAMEAARDREIEEEEDDEEE